MNLEGRYYPDPHPGWGQCAEELFFYSSRYLAHTAKMLQRLCGFKHVELGGYRASQLDKAQRACLAKILASPPNGEAGRKIMVLVSSLVGQDPGNQGAPDVPCVDDSPLARPFLRLAVSRPRCSSGLHRVHPLDPIRHLGRRYGFPVVIENGVVLLDCRRCNQFLYSADKRISRNMIEALQCLNRAGYGVRTLNVQNRAAAGF